MDIGRPCPAVHSPACAGGRDTRVVGRAVGRVGLGRARAYRPGARRGGRAAGRPGSPTSTINCAAPRIATSDSARDLAASFGWPLCVEREDVARARAARAALDRGCRAHGAPWFFRAGARPSRCGCRRPRPHARRSGRDLPAPSASGRGAARPRGDASASRGGGPSPACPAGATSFERTSPNVRRRTSRTNRTPTSVFRAIASAPSCCRCSKSGSIRRLSTFWQMRPIWRARRGNGWKPRRMS